MTEEEASALATSLGLVLQRQKDVYRIKDAEDGSIVGYVDDAPGGWGLSLEDVEILLSALLPTTS
ncbi:hypothetical protein EDF52_10290 [Curtobacterium sp. PhB42]|uniref:hypothetical protein n=1 Tax=unclassified Curtobacterium TaxID=257496 RepID=UPI0010630A8B|nr:MULTISPECIES: hypothetical protein [unclassified Curtobacterium]TDW51002.1 hypothetical protein EDF52_10290 [Curtobacterium sp. PhB42]TDW56152.1 hypothetical protein EDF47_104263 [Curtobacterium sp. PhB190]